MRRKMPTFDPLFNKLKSPEEIIEQTIDYCRTCNQKLKTSGGRNLHIKQKHEVLKMKIQQAQPDPTSNHIVLIQNQQNPYELLQSIDYSENL